LGLLKEGVDDGEPNFDLDVSTDDETSDDDAPWVAESSDGGEAEVQEALQVSEAKEEGIGGVSAGNPEFLGDLNFPVKCKFSQV
jgi:hypothetical protein